mgnify:FL=1
MAIDDKTQKALSFLAENNDGGEKKYPYNRVTQYSCGHKIEFYEEKGEEHIQIRHGTTGSYIKMYPTGDIQIHSPARDINIVAARHIHVKTGENVDAEQKDASDRFVLHVVGNAHVDVEGDMHTHVRGNRHDKVDGLYTLDVGDKYIVNAAEGGLNIRGTYTIDVNKYYLWGANIQRNLKKGGVIRDSFSGTYIIEQTSKGGVLQLKSEGDMQIDVNGHMRTTVKSNSINKITGKVEFDVSGKRVLGAPTAQAFGSLGSGSNAFLIKTSAGKINISASGEFGMDCGSKSLFDSGGNMTHKAPRIDLNP